MRNPEPGPSILDPAREPVAVHFHNDGLFVCQRHPSRVERPGPGPLGVEDLGDPFG